MKRFTILLLSLLTISLSACATQPGVQPEISQNQTPSKAENTAAPQPTDQTSQPTDQTSQAGQTSQKWQTSQLAVFSEKDPKNANSVSDEGTLQIGKTTDGKDIFAFVRMGLDATWLADEIAEARLFLKLTTSDIPKTLQIGLLNGTWDTFLMSRIQARTRISNSEIESVPVAAEAHNYISIPVTSAVKAWVSGGIQNNGLAIFGETAGELLTFISQGKDTPYILASGTVTNRAVTYGKFGYKEMVNPSETDLKGNCMSYALRDTDMILEDNLKAKKRETERIYKNGGLDALTDYFAELVTAYVQAHKVGLQISNFRKIDDFNAAIEPAKEYRIALRLGVNLLDGKVDFSDSHSFDYHFWLQLNDGRWAQKFPTNDSQIVPYTGPGISPGKYPWDSSYERTSKTEDYYASKVVYFAITKDTDEFTSHRNGKEK